ncbi:MAG: hypothetical protein JW722_00095 [Demequinaceae bacterium]|nr:hypothetical protein [Demequinaceae bacterium]
MMTIGRRTRRFLGWELAAISLFHAAVLIWGAATWSRHIDEALEAEFGELAPFVDWSSRGAPVEFIMAVLAALAGVGWILVAERGYLAPYVEDWRGRAALVGGGAICLAYATAAIVPFLNFVTTPEIEIERLPSWDALGAWGDASFVLMFLVDVVVVAWWAVNRWREPQTKRAPKPHFLPKPD